VDVLRSFGAAHVDFLVPNRFAFGYGLSPELARVALEREPDVIVTVDNGVSSIEGIELARASGIDVVVTDHHLPGDERPAACALVNPNLPEANFPSGALAGVGVAYYVLGAVRGALRAAGHFERTRIAEPRLADWLDLVAIGTVADVVPLDRNNRILVHQGLRRMRRAAHPRRAPKRSLRRRRNRRRSECVRRP
jgi:single-stranded-DNA-specific exonuclease